MPTPTPNPASEPTDDEFDAQLNGEAPPSPRPPSPKSGAPRTAPRPATPEAAPARQPAPAKSHHSDESLALAELYGFDPLDVDGWSPDELSRRLHRRHLQDLHAPRRQDYPPPAPAPQPQHQPAADDGWETMLTDPVQRDFFRTKDEQTRREIADLKKQLGERQASDRQRTQLEMTERLDDAFASLGESTVPYYGEGSAGELSPQGHEIRRRSALLSAAGVDLTKPLPPIRVLVNRLKAAHAILHPQPAPPEEDDEVVEPSPYARPAELATARRTPPKDPATGRFTRQQWEDGGLLRPSRRNGKPAAEDYGPSGTIAADEFDLGPDDLR